MTEYVFNTIKGNFFRKSKEETASAHRANKKILLSSQEEFNLQYKNDTQMTELLSAVSNIKYCRADAFTDCIAGTIKAPDCLFEEKGGLCFAFCITSDEILFVSDNTESLENILGEMEKHILGKSSLIKFFLIVLEHIIGSDTIFLQKTEDELSRLEDSLLNTIPENFYKDIIRYRKMLSFLHSYYDQLTDLGEQIEESISGVLSPEECMSWQLYTKRTERLHNHTERLIEYLLQIRELYQSQLAARQNKIMTFLTVVTAIFMPLTLITGWYGMNFSNMPELQWNWGYLSVIILSVVIIIAEIAYLKIRKML